MVQKVFYLFFCCQYESSRRSKMSTTHFSAGYVLNGKYQGKNIYKMTKESFGIVSGDDGTIVTDSIFSTAYTELKTISTETVKNYEEISAVHHNADIQTVAKTAGSGAFWFGAAGAVAGGLLAAAVGNRTTYDIDILFTDGEKISIRITSSQHYQEFIRIFNELKTNNSPQNNALPEGSGQPSINGLIERIFIFLEDGDFSKADQYCERVLDIDPKQAKAYVGKLMVDLKVKNELDLKNQSLPNDLTDNPNFVRACKYADSTLQSTLNSYVDSIKKRVEEAERNSPPRKYETAKKCFESAKTSNDFIQAAHLFEEISDFEDSQSYIRKCYDCSLEANYKEALNLMNCPKNHYELEKAAQIFASIKTYKDAAHWIDICSQKAAQLKEDSRKEEKLTIAQRYIYSSKPDDLKIAIKYLRSLYGYKNADEMCKKCENRLIELQEKQQKKQLEAAAAKAKKQLEAATTEEELLKAIELFDKIGKKINIVTVSGYDSNELTENARIELNANSSAAIHFVTIDSGNKGFLGIGKKPIIAKAFIV